MASPDAQILSSAVSGLVPATYDTDGVLLPSISNWSAAHPTYAPHEQAAEIIRQVDYYFSDENLISDPYLLGFTGTEGTKPVNLSLILSFKKMKQFRPKTAVREALKASKVVEVVDNHHIRRRQPLTSRVLVTPCIDPNRHRKLLAQQQHPHLTKNMLKPTGFEENVPLGPISPEQYEKDLQIYNPDDSIVTRLDNAVAVFDASRKMHQDTRAIFHGLMKFSGFDHGANQFQGGVDKERDRLKDEGWSKEDIAMHTAYYSISETVRHAIYDEMEGKGKSDWVVDFEAVAKGYLSTIFLQTFVWYEKKIVDTACQVLRNFYQFLMTHSVCPEYNDQLLAARKVCDQAQEELPILAIADRSLPGAFNGACSTLCEGAYAKSYRSPRAVWSTGGEDNMGLSREDADLIYKAGVAAYGLPHGLDCVSSQKLGLEIIGAEPPTEHAKKTYDDVRAYAKEYRSLIYPMGKLVCKRWDVPNAPPEDLPERLTKIDPSETFQLLVEEETLKFCTPGFKMEAVVTELESGVKFLDSIERMWPSFYTCLPNESMLEWKEPGEPKGWMKRQVLKRKGIDPYAMPAEESCGEGDEERKFSDEEVG